ncbi:Ig-like domain-containing protein [Photobacterium damselae]|uniref:Ig-like domain-containing protein n=2 Tax=Photobacterium damselae TaxID=38293 RepID=UPI001075E515|nr:Ig-like domain-containing protein [Photobacterium damselae]MBE8127729.1 Ig-like domain repeat protein [Photobacterium damselae subsp. piscicida]WIH21993.1 Ig-like domain repeat protein [Photobacterium damselae]
MGDKVFKLAVSISTAACFLIPINVNAKIKEVQIIDGDNVSIAAKYGTTYTVSNHNNIRLLTVSGLDTKVETSIFHNGLSIFNETSPVININDRITAANGDQFYGRVSSIPQLKDGQYTVSQRVTDIFGTVLSNESFSIISDTQAPTLGNFFWNAPDIKSDNLRDGSFIGDFEVSRWGINGVTDNESGIDHVEAFATEPGKQDRIGNLITLAYNEQEHKAEQSSAPTIFPSQEKEFDLWFVAYDKAGNSSSLKRRVTYTGRGPTPEPVGLFDGTSTHLNFLSGSPFAGYRPYKPGATVYNTRFRIAYRIPAKYGDPNYKGRLYSRSNEFDTNEYHQGEYRYFSAPLIFNPTGSPAFTAVVARYDRWFSQDLQYSLKLDSKIAPPPTPIKAESYYPNLGWLTDDVHRISTWSGDNAYPTKYRVTAQPRPYEQRVFTQFNGRMSNCVIPPNQTKCEINNTGPDSRTYSQWPNANQPASILGHSHGWTSYIVKSDDHAYRSHALGNNNVEIDMTTPIITNVKKIEYKSGFQVKAHKTYAGAHWTRIQMSAVGLKLVDKSTNKTYEFKVEGKLGRVLFRDKYGYDIAGGGAGMNEYVEIKDIPNATYSVQAWAMDTHLNKSYQDLGTFTYENDKPQVIFSHKNKPINSEQIGKLPDIDIDIKDANKYVINSVELMGGPTDDHVTIGIHANGTNRFQLETPRIFPSKTIGEGYSIKIVVTDVLGNTTEHITPKFRYYPDNVISLKAVKTITAPKLLLLRNDDAPMKLTFNNLITEDGSYASGKQQYYLTVRKDAKFSVVVGQTIVSPGETKQLEVDFGNNASKVQIPINAIAREDGSATIMADFPQLTSQYSK